MPDYSKAKIYAIRAPGADAVYIGSTTLPLSRRMAQHRYEFNNGSLKYRSRELLICDGAYIELLEDFPCANKEQLNKREGEVIRATPGCVNYQIAGRTSSEWYQDTKEKRQEYNKVYYESHKETVIARAAEWKAKNPDKAREIARKTAAKRRAALKEIKSALPVETTKDGQDELRSCSEGVFREDGEAGYIPETRQ